jgi:hypothetical protein
MNIAEILSANINTPLKVSLKSGLIFICRIINVDDWEHDDAFAIIETVIEGLGRAHVVPGTYLRFFFSEVGRIEKEAQVLYESGR